LSSPIRKERRREVRESFTPFALARVDFPLFRQAAQHVPYRVLLVNLVVGSDKNPGLHIAILAHASK